MTRSACTLALMALGVIGFLSSMALCGLVLWAGLTGLIGAGVTFIIFALFRSLYGGLGSAAPPAGEPAISSTAFSSHAGSSAAVSSSSSMDRGLFMFPYCSVIHIGAV